MADEAQDPETHAFERSEDDEEPTDLRKLSEDQLDEILAAHKRWVLSWGNDGRRADLSKVDLRGTNRFGSDLREANLKGRSGPQK